MVDIFKEFYRAEPRYNQKYETLMKNLTTYGGGQDKEVYLTGKYFSNAYELYMYATMIGIYMNKKVPINKQDSRRFWNIGNWKYDDIIKFIIMSLFSKSQENLIEWEDLEDDEVRKRIRNLIELMQEYANGGLEYINTKMEEDPDYFDDTSFVRLLSDCIQ